MRAKAAAMTSMAAHNHSANFGVEGPSADPAINDTRRRLRAALLATTLLSQGTPMLAAGDELGHTQGGNNNPYCQDNEISWLDWSRADQAMVELTRRFLQVHGADWDVECEVRQLDGPEFGCKP